MSVHASLANYRITGEQLAWGQCSHSKYGGSRASGKQKPWSIGISSIWLLRHGWLDLELLAGLTSMLPACLSVLKSRRSKMPILCMSLALNLQNILYLSDSLSGNLGDAITSWHVLCLVGGISWYLASMSDCMIPKVVIWARTTMRLQDDDDITMRRILKFTQINVHSEVHATSQLSIDAPQLLNFDGQKSITSICCAFYGSAYVTARNQSANQSCSLEPS